MLRSDTVFTINSVTFSNMTGGGNTISNSNLKYNFVGYQYLSSNSSGVDNLVRTGSGNYPGNYTAYIYLEVNNVQIPDTDDAQMDFYFWQATTGWYNKPDRSYTESFTMDDISVNSISLLNDNFEGVNSNGWTVSNGTWSVVTDGTKAYKQTDGNKHYFFSLVIDQ